MNKLNWKKHPLHILICVNSREEVSKKSSCGENTNFKLEDLKKLKEWIKEKNLIKKVKITRTYCLGICPKNGFIVLKYPEQEYYHLENLDEIKTLILENF